MVAATSQGEHGRAAVRPRAFEDGTVNYLGIPAVEIGLRHIERIGIDTISRRVEALGTWLLAALQRLRHADGGPAVRVYGPTAWDGRGATIAFNFLHPDGRVVDERFVDMRRRGARHLGPDRLLLQPGRRRGRVPALAATRWSAASSATT